MATGPGVSIDISEKRFAGAALPLFQNLRLNFAPGSTTVLLGPSGVGKSTLLRIIAGVDRRCTGTVRIGGVPAHAAPAPGFVFQDPRLLPWLTIIDNIRAINPNCSRDTANAALAQVGLSGLGDQYPHQLSGGMQRRAALARAYTGDANLILLDEPFVSLDPTLVAEMRSLFRDLAATSGKTAVIVSHDTEDAVRLADRVIVLGDRPARVLADLVWSIPTAGRDEATLARYRAEIGRPLT